MIDAEHARKNMPSYQGKTTEEILQGIESSILAASKQGAASIWITHKEDYSNNLSAEYVAAISVLREKGYRLEDDVSQDKPALRIYWTDRPEEEEITESYNAKDDRRISLAVFAVLAIILAVLVWLNADAIFGPSWYER